MSQLKPHPIFGVGPLSRPLPRRARSGQFDMVVPNPEHDRLLTENIRLLFKHYGAERSQPGQEHWEYWADLFRKIAFDLVPGLREEAEKPRRGRPRRTETQEARDARFELLRIARDISRDRRYSESAPKWTNVAMAKHIKKRLDAQSAPHFFKGSAERTIRYHFALALREASERKHMLALGAALRRYSPWSTHEPKGLLGLGGHALNLERRDKEG